MAPYTSLCDDFGIVMHLHTQMPLPNTREAVLHYFDTVQRSFPRMNQFSCKESGDFFLEEDKQSGSHRWVSLEPKRICSGAVNPGSFGDADKQHLQILELAPFHFGISGLDVDSLDVAFSFDFAHSGNHDEAVAEAMGLSTSLESLLDVPAAKVIKFEPSVVLALDEAMRLQCRLSIETRTSTEQIRSGQFDDEPISVYFTIRQCWQGENIDNLAEAYKRQRKRCQEIVDRYIIPSVIQPLTQVINGSK